MFALCKSIRPDRIWHLGDAEGCEDEIAKACGCPLEIVRGNCDIFSTLPEEIVLSAGTRTALYGHTHCPLLKEVNGVTIVNPGSISFPRQSGGIPTYALLTADGAAVKEYTIVIYGDLNGDGKVSNVDLVLMQKQILALAPLEGAALEAADVSRDGGVSNRDLVMMQKHILGIEKIRQ